MQVDELRLSDLSRSVHMDASSWQHHVDDVAVPDDCIVVPRVWCIGCIGQLGFIISNVLIVLLSKNINIWCSDEAPSLGLASP